MRTQLGHVVCSIADKALLACVIEGRDMEPGSRFLTQQLLQAGDTYVDVGANIGLHVLAAARAMARKGKIFVF